MINVPDHPVIQNCERSGWPDGKEQPGPRCPVCGSECSDVIKTRSGEIVGCDECLCTADAWEEDECFPEREGWI